MAQSTVNVYGSARATADGYNGTQGSEIQQQYNNRGDLIVAQALPQRSELVRLGGTWVARIATASAFTYVAAWPTTRAELVLYNGEAAGGKSYIIQSAWMYGITSMAAAQPATLIGQLVPVAGTVPTDDTAQLISSRSGKMAYNGRAKRAVANTSAGQAANLWEVLATSLAPSMTTNLGAAIYADLMGAYIVPPGGVFALAGIAGTAAGTAIIGVCWSEVQLALG
jgi:hypothetical protein